MQSSLKQSKRTPTPPLADSFETYTVEVWKMTSLDWEQSDLPDFTSDHLLEGMNMIERDHVLHPEWKYRVVHTTVSITELYQD